ncbi:MAG TPA: class I SAM-dependent methyltransferase [Candidatus Thioglobus sp.]|nr:class I SAM-dependent methyltransferase [Candidatus Thioglobus sp.]
MTTPRSKLRPSSSLQNHWELVYKSQNHAQVSWHQKHSTTSLDWILEHTKPSQDIIDVGSGVSILTDNLIEEGYSNLSAVELSESAIIATQKRLGGKESLVRFYCQNILDFETDQRFDLWHDRAVFHFLTHESEQKKYINKLNTHLAIGGYFLLATFAPDGPTICSNLDVASYDEKAVRALLADDFRMIKTASEDHITPTGKLHQFNYFLLQKISTPPKNTGVV